MVTERCTDSGKQRTERGKCEKRQPEGMNIAKHEARLLMWELKRRMYDFVLFLRQMLNISEEENSSCEGWHKTISTGKSQYLATQSLLYLIIHSDAIIIKKQLNVKFIILSS